MRVALFTREYPPHVYGGAGVHVEYLSRELARLAGIEVEVHCFGEQQSREGRLTVSGHEPWPKLVSGAKFQAALEALSVNLDSVQRLDGVDVVHTHTWYAAMAGFWAKKLYGMPFVLTTHSLEPLRAWKAEQLGSGYFMSSWMEKTAIESADAVIAVSNGTKADILRAYPGLDPGRIHVIYNGIDLDEYRRDGGTEHLDALG
ncbi:MAG: glycosyltransferase, partial [Chloroflexota bacterium]